MAPANLTWAMHSASWDAEAGFALTLPAELLIPEKKLKLFKEIYFFKYWDWVSSTNVFQRHRPLVNMFSGLPTLRQPSSTQLVQFFLGLPPGHFTLGATV